MLSVGNKSLPRISQIDTDSRYISVNQCYQWEIETKPMKHFQLITAMALCTFVLAFDNWGARNSLGELEAPNVSALPTKSRTSWGLCGEKKWKENYEKISIDIISKSVRIWRSIIACGLRLPTIGRDPSLCSHRLWRDTHLQREFDRDRLQI